MTINDVMINIEQGKYCSSNFMNRMAYQDETRKLKKDFQEHLALALSDEYSISKKVADVIVSYAFDDCSHDGYYDVVIRAEDYAEVVVKCLKIS